MDPPPPLTNVASSLLATQGLQLRSLHTLQSLWAGYGYVCHVAASRDPSQSSTAEANSKSDETTNTNFIKNASASSSKHKDGAPESYIIKAIAPLPAFSKDEGHIRKILSYQVEQYFYTHLASRMPVTIPVAKCFASINERHNDGVSTTAMMMTDLREEFPVSGEKRAVLNKTQVHAALDWLSSFHGYWWKSDFTTPESSAELVRPPLEEGNEERQRSVWLNGGYTYLATRRKEYESLKSDRRSEWCKPLTDILENGISVSEMVAAILAPSKGLKGGPTDDYQTLIHGDVKSENLMTTADGKRVAFYDFQYVGLGLGVCDLAKLFTCSVPLAMLIDEEEHMHQELEMQPGEKLLLERYLKNLTEVSGKSYEWGVFVRHWECGLVDWLRFQASWGFWGNTEWLEARVRCILKDAGWLKSVNQSHLSL